MSTNNQEQAAVVATDAATVALEAFQKAVAANAKKPSTWDNCKSGFGNGVNIGCTIGVAVIIVTAAVCAVSYIPKSGNSSV